jgi:hypothetical protein
MKRILMTIAAAAALTAYAPMLGAQAPAPGSAPSGTPTVNLTVEQRHVIKEVVKDLKLDKATGNLQVAVGEKAPNSVQTHPFPPEVFQKVPQVRNHTFFLKDDRVVIVSPRDNTIADVID